MKTTSLSRRRFLKFNGFAFAGFFLSASTPFLPSQISRRFIHKVESNFEQNPTRRFEPTRAAHENTEIISEMIRRYSSNGLLLNHFREDEVKNYIHSIRWTYEFNSETAFQQFQRELHSKRNLIWPGASGSDDDYYPKELGYTEVSYPVYRLS